MKIIRKISILEKTLSKNYPKDIFSNLSDTYDLFTNHKEIAEKLINKNPYSVTVIIDNLNPKLWHNKKYAQPIRINILTKYTELLYKYFFEECGNREGNEVYGKYLERYRSVWKQEGMKKEIDDYVIKHELEPRYREKILKRYKDLNKLKKSRCRIERKRYYNLPFPLNHVDGRNPYDNIFVWQEGDKKLIRRGGSGSSGQREINSLFTFGFGLINQKQPISSYLFLYSDKNELFFIKKFSSFCIPYYDIGSNYFLSENEQKQALKNTLSLKWDSFNQAKEMICFNNEYSQLP